MKGGNYMITFNDLIDKIKSYEGWREKRYICPSGVVTIGYGFTANCFDNGVVPKFMTITEGDRLLSELVEKHLKKVQTYLKNWGYSTEDILILQYPLTDFAYNCGFGNLQRLTQNGTRTVLEISGKITEYNKANGVELTGLTKRRKWERDAIMSAYDYYNQTRTPVTVYTVFDIQRWLNVHHDCKLTVDGICGKNTCSAIMQYLK